MHVGVASKATGSGSYELGAMHCFASLTRKSGGQGVASLCEHSGSLEVECDICLIDTEGKNTWFLAKLGRLR